MKLNKTMVNYLSVIFIVSIIVISCSVTSSDMQASKIDYTDIDLNFSAENKNNEIVLTCQLTNNSKLVVVKTTPIDINHNKIVIIKPDKSTAENGTWKFYAKMPILIHYKNNKKWEYNLTEYNKKHFETSGKYTIYWSFHNSKSKSIVLLKNKDDSFKIVNN